MNLSFPGSGILLPYHRHDGQLFNRLTGSILACYTRVFFVLGTIGIR